MEILLFFMYCSFFVVTLSTKNNLVEYYINLIESEIERSESYSSPSNSQEDKPSTTNWIEYGTFDHIIIGAGSAGAIAAGRLSEDEFREVLLLEAGGPATNFTEIPSMSGYLINLEYNWNYYSIPQTTSCLGMREKKCYFPRGKILGGSSGINGLLYTRGSKNDFDDWCNQGNPGWSYADVLPFFKKYENSKIYGDPTYHGINGYISVDYAKPTTKQQLAFIEGNEEIGSPFVDYNAFRQEGVGFSQMNIDHGRRSSSNEFLKVASNRSNLKVLTHSHVVRILVSRKGNRAFGVLFARNNKYYVVKSRSDIILSAGAVGSPQLLMLSGIGPKHHLEELHIPVIKDLSVGRNLQEHVAYPLLHVVTNFSMWDSGLKENVKDYLMGIGAFTDPFKSKGITFLRTKLIKRYDFSDIEVLLMGTNSTSSFMKRYFNLDDETFNFGYPTVNNSRFFSILVIVLHPASRGYVKLKTSDPFDYPIIDPRLLSDSKDIDTLYEGIQESLKLLESDAFKKLDAQLFHSHLPACKRFQYLSKEYWHCQIRQSSTPMAHISGTCKMGSNPLEGAVVDHQLKVYGIENLRVADASVMPLIPGAHTNAPSMMIGEKVAHMIRNYKYKKIDDVS